MKIQSQFCRSFYSDSLNKAKFDVLMAHAVKVRDIKNELSTMISSNLLKYLEMSKFDSIKEFETLLSGRLPSADLKCLIEDVHTAYQNKFEVIQRKIEFKMVKEINYTHYQRRSGKFRAGDLKSVEVKYRKTRLSMTLTYLSRYGNPGTLTYLQSNVSNVDEKKQKFYQTILETCEHFGFQKLLDMALAKRQRLLEKYGNQIEFMSLTFTGNNRIATSILDYNSNFNSEINAFITLGNFEGHKQFNIPVKYCKQHHGKLGLYQKGRNTTYTVCFEEDDAVRIILAYKGERPAPDSKANYLGVDVNMKRNMFSTSENFTLDFDRKLVSRYADELLRLDELKKDKAWTSGKRRAGRLASFKRKLQGDVQRKSVELVRQAKALGKDHLVMENLTGFSGSKTFGKDGETELKISRLSRELKLSSLKDVVGGIAANHDVTLSLVHPEYTSQECSVCGCIDKENRTSQDRFCCVACGHTEDADFQSPKNMVRRVVSDVLRQRLLKDKYGSSGSLSQSR